MRSRLQHIDDSGFLRNLTITAMGWGWGGGSSYLRDVQGSQA